MWGALDALCTERKLKPEDPEQPFFQGFWAVLNASVICITCGACGTPFWG